MFEAFQTWAVGLAVVLDSALLFVLLERRNRPFARVPIVNLLVGAWMLHAGAFLLLTVGPLPGFEAGFRKICLLAMASGMLLMPSAMLHGAIRYSRTGLDLRKRPNPAFALVYLPVVAVVFLAFALEAPTEPSLLGPLLPWRMPYLVWSTTANLIAASLFLRQPTRADLVGVRPFLRTIAGLLIVQTALDVFLLGLAWHDWAEWRPAIPFVCGIPSVLMATMFSYFLLRFNVFRLAMERAIVYGAVLAAIAMLHQFLFQEASLALPRSYRFALVAVEAAFVAAVLVLYRPLRERLAEAIRYLTGSRVTDRRERLRNFSIRLSAQVQRSPEEILMWFATELTAALDVDFLAGWIVLANGDVHARYGDAGRLADEHAAILLGHMRSTGLATCYPPYALGDGRLEAFQRAGISLAIRREHEGIAGLLLVGKHARSRDLTEEEASAVHLLVEQLAITLDNSRLIADRLLAERRAGHLEKLSALGLMSSAIAHEIKNPLSAVKTIATVLQENLGPDSPHAEDVAVIRGEIDRLAATTQQLLAFARPDPIGDRAVCVGPVLASTAQILRRLAGPRDIELETQIADDLPAIRGDETTLREIVFNLVSNSLDAASAGGRVTLRGQRVNGHVVIEVRDDGHGIAPAVKSRLFEPFVTTRSTGTGLGLYVVRRRVAELGGDIECRSVPGDTTFLVKIPAHDAANPDRR
jgi:signal transduction histidine kinase